MNDFGTSAPQLINQSTLTIGAVFSLGADSIVDNAATVSVGGLMEVLDSSVLQNSGAIYLGQGGDFGDQSTVTNSGTIDVCGGTLNILTDVDNAGGQMKIDGAARLMLNGASIDGGAVTDNGEIDLAGAAVLKNGSLVNSGLIKVSGSGNALEHEIVINTGGIEVLGLGALTLDQLTRIVNGGSAITVDSAGTLTLNGATITGGTLRVDGTFDSAGTGAIIDVAIINNGLIEATSGVLTIQPAGGVTITNRGTIEANGGDLNITNEPVTNTGTLRAINDSTLKLASTVVTNTGGTVTNESGSTLELVGATVNGGTLGNGGALNLQGGVLRNGSLANSGQITVSGTGNAFDRETVTANSMLEILAGGALLLDQGTTVANAGGLILVDAAATLTLDGASINGGTVTDNGAIHISGSSEINGASLSNGGVTVDSGQTLKLDNVVVTGTTFVDTASGATLSVDTGNILTLQGGASVIGGTLVNAGTVQIETTSGAMLDGVDVVNAGGTIQVDAVPSSSRIVLTLEGGTTVTDGVLSVGNIGTVKIASGSTATLDSVTVNNGAGPLPSGLIEVNGTLQIDGVTINGGTIVDYGTINVISTSTIHAATVTNSGMLEVTGGTLTIDAASSLNNDGMIEVNGGNLIVDPAFSGSARIVGASLLELGASFVGAYSFTSITFADGATGTLKLDHVGSFGGTIYGLDDNTLDLGDIAYGANVTVSYSGTADGGILSIFENGIGVSDINLSGNYLGVHWVLADDGSSQHGTKVTEAPGAITGLDSNGNAIQGVAITALVTDGGQSVTGATYQWQLDGHDILNATDAVYVPTESDEGHALTVEISYIDALHNAETSSASAGTVQEAAGGNLVATLESSGAMLQAMTEPAAAASTVIAATGVNQTLFGTAGSDTFAFNFAGIGHDTVVDFHPDADVLQFDASIFAKPQAVLDAIHDDGYGNTVIALDAHDTITLAGILKAQLTLSDFHTV